MKQEIAGMTEQSILVVDDNPANVQLLSRMLKTRGYKVRAALNGELALQAARSNSPDLILLDINMPEMNGYEVCELLKADEATRGIPVIFISALSETTDKVRAFEAGGVDYITKPFQFKEVEARVNTHLQLCRQQTELERSYARLREAENLRDNLVHMIAHDLRNSLTAVSGYYELVMLKDGKALSEKSVNYLRRGEDAVSSLVHMINTMLDVSRMEAGALKLNITPFDLVGAAARVLSDMEIMRGKIDLTLDSPVDFRTVPADRDLITRVIQNLVGNALKCVATDGWVCVSIEPGDGVVRVTVKDNGPGIAPEFHEKIFEKFGKADNGSSRANNSTGLGLAFCKLAVEAHEGRIGVESEPGKGSTFWFELKS
jgi:two-component system, sensor histidine kinase and response regulator